jgi:putative redox protein
MKVSYSTKHIGGMAFEMVLDGHHKLVMDANEEVGGNDQGVRPKQLLISALTGCTGMDVVSILKKMKVEYNSFELFVDTEASEDHPKVYTDIHIIYQFTGDNLEDNYDKIEKAVNLSQEKYCGVNAMLKQAANITHEIRLMKQ